MEPKRIPKDPIPARKEASSPVTAAKETRLPIKLTITKRNCDILPGRIVPIPLK